MSCSAVCPRCQRTVISGPTPESLRELAMANGLTAYAMATHACGPTMPPTPLPKRGKHAQKGTP